MYNPVPFDDSCMQNSYSSLSCQSFMKGEDVKEDCQFRQQINKNLMTANESMSYLKDEGLWKKNNYWRCLENIVRVCISEEE